MQFNGVCQRDCLSAIFFIFYLSISLTPEKSHIVNQDHNYARPEPQPSPIPATLPLYADHTYSGIEHSQEYKDNIDAKPASKINPKYADDIMWVIISKERIHQIEQTVPLRLKARQLCINESETEYTVEREGDESADFLDLCLIRMRTLPEKSFNNSYN